MKQTLPLLVLSPKVALTPLGLPVRPFSLPRPVAHPPSRALLERLHRLAALSPPAEGTAAAARLSAELGELIGLMDMVHAVELPEAEGEGEGGRAGVMRDLLGQGVGEFVLGPREGGGNAMAKAIDDVAATQGGGRELLEYATRRVGDYYASKI
ncbi:hypothetical protein Q5752_005637 [Cryptotrichosporon argae]